MSPSRPPRPRVPQPERPARPRPVSDTGAPRPDSETSARRPVPASPGRSVPTPARPSPRPEPEARRASARPRTAVPVSTDTAPTPFGRAVTTYTGGRGGPVRPPVVSTTSVARFAERAKARRTVARRKVVLAACAAAAVAAVAWLLFLSPVLVLEPAEVDVRGAGTVVAVDQVLAAVDQHAGTPLPRLDTVGLRDRVLEVPGVREARVTRTWPHGLTVVLVAREPVAAVPEPAQDGAGPGFALLDMDGVQVGRVDAAPEGLPVVDVPVGDKRALHAVLTVLQQLPADLLAQVASVSAHTQDRVTMILRDGVEVDWGSAVETPLKIAVLGTLRASPATQGATVFDVSAPRLPITR